MIAVFTRRMERVPCFCDRDVPGVPTRRYGWKVEKRWRPGFVAVRVGGQYKVHNLNTVSMGDVIGYVDWQDVSRWEMSTNPMDRRFPTIAAVEMYLRATS